MSEASAKNQSAEGNEDPRAALCSSVTDLYQGPARGMIGTLARSFLDQMVVTPTELLHSSRHQLRLEGAGTLMRDIMERAASAQARIMGIESRDRAKQLQKILDDGAIFIREVEKGAPPPDLVPGQLAASIQRALAGVPPDQGAIRVNRMLTEHLISCRTWVDKLDKVMALATEVIGRPELKWLDILLAELVISDAGQDTVFGRRISLEDRIDDLIDTLKDQYPSKPKIGDLLPMAVAFQKLMRTADLPETRTALETAIVQLIASRNPFSSQEMMNEMRATHGVLMRLRLGDRILGGRRSLEYIDKRMQRILTEENVADYIRTFTALGERVSGVLELYSLTFGPRNKRLLESQLERYFADEDFAKRLLAGEGTGPHKVRILTSLYQSIVSAPLEKARKAEFAGRIASMQADYIAESRFFANFDKQFPTLARKAAALIDLTREGLFIPGDNTDRARAVVKHYISRPEFMSKLGEGLPPPARDAAVAQFKQKLADIGLALPGGR